MKKILLLFSTLYLITSPAIATIVDSSTPNNKSVKSSNANICTCTLPDLGDRYTSDDCDLDGGEISEDQTICSGETAGRLTTLTRPSGGEGSYNYQWQYSIDNTTWIDIDNAKYTYYRPGKLTETTYYRKKTTDDCGVAYSNMVIITVYDELGAGTISSSQSVCYGSDVDSITGTSATGGSGDFTYQWQKSTNELTWNTISEATSESYLPEESTTLTFYRRKVTDNTCNETLYSDTVYIVAYEELSAGTISSTQTLCYYSTADTLTVTSVSGGSGDYTYQWQLSTDGSTWSAINNATNESYFPVETSSLNYYRLQVTDDNCGVSAYSNTITITIYDAYDGGEITDDQTLCNGEVPEELTTITDVSRGDGNYEYQWQYSYNDSTWIDIDDAQNSYYQPEELTETTYYRKETSDECGIVYSNSVEIIVEAEFSVGTIGEDQYACENCSISPITTTEEPSTSYGLENQWQQSTNGTTWEDIDGETADSLTISDLEETTYFRKKVTTNCGEGYTNTVSIIIYPTLEAGTISFDQEIEYNTQPEVLTGTKASGGSGNYSYQWQYSYDEDTWYDLSEASKYNYQPDTLTRTTYFRRQVSEENCTTVYTNIVTISIAYDLDPGTIASSQTICSGTIPEELTGTSAYIEEGTLIYYWESSSDSIFWSDIDGENEETYQPGEISALTYFRRRVECDSIEAYSNIIYIDTLEHVNVPTLTIEDSYCTGDEVTVELNASDTVVWYDSNKSVIQQSGSFTFTADPDTLYYYTVIDTSGCYGEITLVDITINYVDVAITTDNDDIENVTNGDHVIFYPNVDSNLDESEFDYTWTFTHEDKGWYETLYDKEPEEYFHWEGWYSIELEIEMPGGCKYTYDEDDYMYVLEEVDEDATKSGNKDRDKLSADFGTDNTSPTTIAVYPNPVGDILYIEVQNNNEVLPVKFYNSVGLLIYEDSIEGNEFVKTIDTGNLNQGIYFITIGSSNYKITKK